MTRLDDDIEWAIQQYRILQKKSKGSVMDFIKEKGDSFITPSFTMQDNYDKYGKGAIYYYDNVTSGLGSNTKAVMLVGIYTPLEIMESSSFEFKKARGDRPKLSEGRFVFLYFDTNYHIATPQETTLKDFWAYGTGAMLHIYNHGQSGMFINWGEKIPFNLK